MRVRAVLTDQNSDIADLLNTVAGDYADSLLGVLIAESGLNEQAFRDGKWPDYSAGLSQVIAANLGFGTYQTRPSEDELELYRNYMFVPEHAIKEGWRYYLAALKRMDYDPLWAALSYNRGPSYTREQLEQQVANDPAIARRFERYRQSFEAAEVYRVADSYTIGPGVRAAMDAAGDVPRSDEAYVREGISETFGRDAIYYYYAEDNRTSRVPLEVM